MDNKPQFKIHGKARREKKHELAELKSYLKNIRYCNDVCIVMGGGMEESEVEKQIIITQLKIKIIEKEINEPYTD